MKHTKQHTRLSRIFSLVMAFAMVLAVLPMVPQIFTASAVTQSEVDKKVDELNKKIADAQKDIDANNADIADAEKTASGIQKEIDAYQTKIDAVQSKIDLLTTKINTMNSKITELETSIKELQASIQEQEDTIEETQTAVANRMRAMYLSGNISNLELILEADSFGQLLNRIELIARVTRNDKALINKLEEEISSVKEQQKQMASEEAEIQSSKQEVESSKQELESEKSDIAADKAVVDAKKKKLDNYIDSLEDDNDEKQAYIAQIEKQKQAWMNALVQQNSNKGSTGSGKSNGTMVWPVPCSDSYVSSGYGTRTLNGRTYTHYGMDITCGHASNYNVSVVAADSGTIITSSNACSHNYRKSSSCGCNGGYGNMVVIDNGQGLHIYYGHLYKSTVSVGQTVSAGQTVGILGCTGYSTGPHLHFEIRVNDGSSRAAAARNPSNYVSK